MSREILKSAKEILTIEAHAIESMTRNLGKEFLQAIELLYRCEGRVIITGMGKPGFIARKIAATLASTGTPSLYVHPAEALHGDLGMVTDEDVMLAISQSGETEEILKLIEGVKRTKVPIIAMTSNRRSTLARQARVILDLGVNREACPLNLAPSASTTASLAMGDALALCLLKKKGFKEQDFASLHPGGSLGRKLLKVKDIMRTGKEHAVVSENTTVKEALLAITTSRAGSCSIVSKKGQLKGIFTDGDLRRHLRQSGENFLNLPVSRFATLSPIRIQQDRLASEALHIFKTKKIDELPVVDVRDHAVGLLDVQDLLKAGFV